MYKPFSEVYRTETTEKDRPSLQSSAEKQCHGMPFNPSAQFARNVAKTLDCTECNRPRVMYAACKVRFEDLLKLEKLLDDVICTCGMDLQECIPVDITDDEKQNHILSRVFVRQNLNCDSRIEVPYFSSECFASVCIYCGSVQNLVPASETEGMYPFAYLANQTPTNLEFSSGSVNSQSHEQQFIFILNFEVQF